MTVGQFGSCGTLKRSDKNKIGKKKTQGNETTFAKMVVPVDVAVFKIVCSEAN